MWRSAQGGEWNPLKCCPFHVTDESTLIVCVKKKEACVNGLMVRILPFQGRGPGSIPG